MSASWETPSLNFHTMKMVLAFGLAVTCCDSEASIKFTVRPCVRPRNEPSPNLLRYWENAPMRERTAQRRLGLGAKNSRVLETVL